MRYVTAKMLTYDASVGRVEPGQRYYVEDDKAERWEAAGVATLTETPPQPQPGPEPGPPQPEPPKPEEDDEEENGEEEEGNEKDAELQSEAKKLYEGGASQREVAEQLGVSRSVVRRLLTD